MIGLVASGLQAIGVAGRFARPLAIAALAIVALAVVAGVVTCHDRRTVAAHDATRRADDAELVIDRGRKADAGDRQREAVDQVQSDQLQGEIENAVTAHPDAAAAGVGPATDAALDGLRRRQARQRRQ